MIIRIIRRAQYVPMPWRNGRGTTYEIFRLDRKDVQKVVQSNSAAPPEGPAQLPVGAPEYAFRVSSAPVNESGPFSFFPGFDRSICVLQGKGMELAVSKDPSNNSSTTDTSIHRALLLTQSAPFHFSGDVKTAASLIDNLPLLDFNVMTLRSAFSQTTKRLVLPPVSTRIDDSRSSQRVAEEDARCVDISTQGLVFVVIHPNAGHVSVASHAHQASVESGDTCVVTIDPDSTDPHSWLSIRGSNDGCDVIYSVVSPSK